MPGDNGNTRRFGARGELLVAIQFALMLGFVLLPVWHPGLGADAMDASGGWRSWLAAPFAVVALILGGFGSVHIRDYLTPLPYPVDHSQLVQHGVYAIVRHPLYASLLFAGAAWTLYHLSLSHLLGLAVAFAFFNYKAGKEEAWLTQRHPEYADYARRVKKLIPWVY
ncbi:isoprenylcysteine carboxylmethyltransferase family protein [uncultured Thiohalocapsa sp.]|uniref:methyltransferase family protein n=1 Tax=uncultured Thiohalocapsa sp. TaxID=768990 RepID=UPI0025CDBFF0|nr:isoprenylcysteine carboxylmethyltransferase family protein [uncultured Thiohalocapsa sp.]